MHENTEKLSLTQYEVSADVSYTKTTPFSNK